MNYKIICSILFMFSSIASQAQVKPEQIIKIGINKYVYQDSSYNKKEMESIFNFSPIYQKNYNKAIARLRMGKVFGYTTIAVYAAGGISLLSSINSDMYCDTFCDGYALTIISWYLIGPITGTIAIINYAGGTFKLNKLIREFNNREYDSIGRMKEQPKLQLATNGVGLRITF